MSDEKPEKPLSVHEELLVFWRRILGAGAFQVLVFGIVCAMAVLYATRALAEEAQHKVDAGVAPLSQAFAVHEREEAVKQEAQDREVQAITRRIEAVERVTLETSLNVRLLVEASKLTPIRLGVGGTDGGVP